MVAEKLASWMKMVSENKTKPKLKTASVRAGENQTAHRHVLRGLLAAGLVEKSYAGKKSKKGRTVEYGLTVDGRALTALLDGHQTRLPATTTTPAAEPATTPPTAEVAPTGMRVARRSRRPASAPAQQPAPTQDTEATPSGQGNA